MTQNDAEELAREGGIVAGALATGMWRHHGLGGGERAHPRVLTKRARATTEVDRPRVGAGQRAARSAEKMVPAFSSPIPDWLPGSAAVCLFEEPGSIGVEMQ